eukprot:jgi/Hompol1/5243/HPOL_004296-RA
MKLHGLSELDARGRPKTHSALVSTVESHFVKHQINEGAVMSAFLYSVTHRGSKLKLPPRMLMQ